MEEEIKKQNNNMLNKSIILYIDILHIAKTESKDYFWGFTFSLYKYKIISYSEFGVIREHYENLINLGDDDYKLYMRNLDELNKNGKNDSRI